MGSKRSILITGCSVGGLGGALAKAFHGSGQWRVIATARNPETIADLAAAGIETLTLDVLSDESIAAAVQSASKMLDGTLDALLLNAGGGLSAPVVDIDIAALRRLYELNVFSPVATVQAFLPLLLAPATAPGSTHRPLVIMHTSVSVLSKWQLPFGGAYASSKAALAGLTRALRFEMCDTFDLDVVELRSGTVKSNFFDHLAKQTTASAQAPTLPKDSIFAPAKEIVEPFMAGDFMTRAVDADDWAKEVVADIEGGETQAVYRGHFAAEAKATDVNPTEVDDLVKQMSRLGDIAQAIKAGKS